MIVYLILIQGIDKHGTFFFFVSIVKKKMQNINHYFPQKFIRNGVIEIEFPLIDIRTSVVIRNLFNRCTSVN